MTVHSKAGSWARHAIILNLYNPELKSPLMSFTRLSVLSCRDSTPHAVCGTRLQFLKMSIGPGADAFPNSCRCYI